MSDENHAVERAAKIARLEARLSALAANREAARTAEREAANRVLRIDVEIEAADAELRALRSE